MSSHSNPIKLLKILLAEDDYQLRKMNTMILKSKGYHVTTAENGFEVLSHLQTDRYDIILMDLEMPVLGGLATTLKIRQLENDNKDIPIIGISGTMDFEKEKECLEAGLNECIGKGSPASKMVEKINRYASQADASTPPKPSVSNADTIFFRKNIPIDIKKSLEKTMNDRNFLEEMLNMFFVKTDERIHALKTSFANQHHTEMEATAHMLKGAAKSLCITHVADSAAEIEAALQANDTTQIESLILKLETQIQELKQYIDFIFQSPDGV